MFINLIVACDLNYGIAKDGKIPWNLPKDIAHFRKITSSNDYISKQNVVIMGKKTYESIGKVLKNRINIVISKSGKIEKTDNNLLVCESPKQALSLCNNLKPQKIYIIGGEQIYSYFWELHKDIIKFVYITFINKDFNCDKFFKIDQSKLLLQDKSNSLTEGELSYQFCVYKLYRDYPQSYQIDRSNIYKAQIYDLYKTNQELQYIDLINRILTHGEVRQTRNAKVLSDFGGQMEFNLSESFPLFTCKQMNIKGIFEELKLFLSGKTNTKILEEKKNNIWKGNTKKSELEKLSKTNPVFASYKEGDMGPLYPFQWRHYGEKYVNCETEYKGFDQISEVIDLIKNDPTSRRILFTSYNPIQAKDSVLYPCHSLIVQFYVSHCNDRNYLSCHTYYRSSDVYLGLPWNIAFSALLVMLMIDFINADSVYVSKHNKLLPHKLVVSLGDIHIYENAIQACKEIVGRKLYNLPTLTINRKSNKSDDSNKSDNPKYHYNDISDYEFEDLELIGYKYHPLIKVEMIA